jgi:hypothetical protein
VDDWAILFFIVSDLAIVLLGKWLAIVFWLGDLAIAFFGE